MIKSVQIYGDKILRERCGSCAGMYEWYSQVAQDMLDTMVSHDGVGLSANQIGLNLRIMVFENGRTYVAIRNPIVEFAGQLEYEDEGCLSLPYLQMPVARYQFASVRGTTPAGDPIPEMLLRGYPARVVQHELDHLNGLTILEATRPASRNVNRRKWLKRYPRLRKWWDNEYLKAIDRANEELRLQAERRDREHPRIVLPGDKEFSTDPTPERVGRGTPAQQLQRRDADSARPSRQPRPVSPDGGYT